MTEPAPAIKALFFSPRTIWLLPNDLVRSQFLNKFFDDRQAADPAGNQAGPRAGFDPEALVFSLGRYPRLETFSSLEQALARELGPPVIEELDRRLILHDLARTLAAHLWPERANPSEAQNQPALSGADLQALAADLGDGFDRLKLAGLGWDQVVKLPPAGLGELLAELGRRHDQLLAGLGRTDRFARRRQVLTELRAGRRFQALADVGEIVCRWSQRLSPFETDFILALARGRQLQLTLKVPAWVRDENIDHGSGFDLLRSIRRIEKCQEPSLWLDFNEYQAPEEVRPAPSAGALKDDPWASGLGLSSPRREPPSFGALRTPDPGDCQPPPALAYAADVLLAPAAYRRADPPDPAGCLRLMRANSSYQEVEEAARIMKERLRSGELKAGDLALVLPDLDRYGPLLDDVSRRFGLAFHFRRGDSLAETGPARAVLDLLALWSSNWERGRLLDFIRNPYFQLGLDPAACHRLALDAGVTDHRAGGGFEDNLAKIDPDRSADGPAARRLLDLLDRLKKAGRRLDRSPGWDEFLLRFKELLRDLSWPGDLNLAPAAPLNIRAADQAAAQALTRELDRLGQAFERSPRPPAVGLTNFRLWLESALGDQHLNWDPNPEGRIRVLNYYDLHGGFFEEIFFLGLGERIFPQTAPESRWWPDELVRGAAELLGRPLWSEAADRYRQEELLFATGLGQARRRVWLFYPAGDENGRQVAPSPLLGALGELWTDEEGRSLLPLEKISGSVSPPLGRVAGPDELWVSLAALPPAGRPRNWPESGDIAAVMERLHLRRERWRQQKSEVILGPEPMRLWLTRRPNHQGRPLLTPRFLAGFEDCPLAFWGREVLGLSAAGDPIEEWPHSSQGLLIHRVLEIFFQTRLGSLWPGQADYESCRAELMNILDQEIDRCVRCDPLGRAPLWELRRARLPELLSGWLGREMAPGLESIRPLGLEWSFGTRDDQAAEPWPFELDNGERLYFQGRADRLDQTREGLSLRDYKLRQQDEFKLRGRSQAVEKIPTRVWPILTYALAAADLLGQRVEAGFDIIEAAGPTGRLTVLSTDEPEMRRPGPAAGAEGLNFPQMLSQTWRALGQGRFPPTGDPGRQCPYCALGLLCPRRDSQDGADSPDLNGDYQESGD